MTKIIPFPKQGDSAEPSIQRGQGEAFCIGCGNKWIANVPTGETTFECPNCHAVKGKFCFEFYPNDAVYECHCGNQMFYLTPEGHLCANCGDYVRY